MATGFAVVLSGGGSDGALGVRAVKEAGGIILVQDPNEAEFPSMPRNATAAGVADFVLPVRELATRLAELIRSKATSAIDETRIDDGVLRRILGQLRARTGHDFSKYKRATILRRIARRMQVNKTDNFVTYIETLRNSETEAPALMADLLISVTTFFRDRDVFDALSTKVLPPIFDGRAKTTRCESGFPAARPAKRPIRSPCCCWKRHHATKTGRRSRSSLPTSTTAPWQSAARASTRPHRSRRQRRAAAAVLHARERPLSGASGTARRGDVRPP